MPLFNSEYNIKTSNLKLNGIYRILSKSSNLYFTIKNNKLILSEIQSNFRFIHIESNLYYIEYKYTNNRLGITNNSKFKFFNIKNKVNKEKIMWNLINIFQDEYLIQNIFNKKFIQVNNDILQFSEKIYQFQKKKFIFNFLKLCEEGKEGKNNFKFVLNEPIDAIIKYIDLTDKTLNRTGIKQIYKDKDNEELKYSIRSLFEYIPWIRKIFIIMPNEKVKYFKNIENIKEKIIYIKDKDFLGYDSANIYAFTFNLFKLEKFGISKNFIYLEDDFFFGKSLHKFDFFYYDEKQKKIVPYLITNYFYEMNITEILEKYNNLYIIKETIHPHSLDGWWMSIYSTDKFFAECYNGGIIIKTRFTHNAKGENIDELKEIFEKVKKYKYINETLFSKERHILTLNQPHFDNLYQLNIKKKKVHSINYKYINVEKLKNDKLISALFVINTSGNHVPLSRQYKLQKKKMEERFSVPTIYEIKNNKSKKENIFKIRICYIKLKLFFIYIFVKYFYLYSLLNIKT